MHGTAQGADAGYPHDNGGARAVLPRLPATLQLKRRDDLVADGAMAHDARLSILTLGTFRLVAGHADLGDSARGPQKPFQVLKALVAFGPEPVNLSALATCLWPEQDGDCAQNACHVAIHRLRKLVGDDRVVEVNHGRARLATPGVFADVHEFRRLVARIDRDVRTGAIRDADGAGRAARELLDLYQGHFLPGDDDPWVVGVREQMRSRFVRVAECLDRLLRRHRADAAAVDLMRRGIELEPLAEAFHQGLMRALHAMGRHAEALNAYERCRQVLGANLGVDPSAETRTLRREVCAAARR